MNRGPASAIDIHERLSVFDGWLTGRIEEAHAGRKDLAFRDRPPGESAEPHAWEYSLLEPGARSPVGDGWSVYRFSGVLPDSFAEPASEAQGSSARRSVIDVIAGAVLGHPRRR
jgi:hypothetical protein